MWSISEALITKGGLAHEGRARSEPIVDNVLLLAATKLESRFWIQHHSFLLDSGYQLRPKYHPDWKPKWKSRREMIRSEESWVHVFASIIDATRVEDGKLVALKGISKMDFPFELELGTFFSSSPLSNDPRNHCVPIYEVLQSPHDPDMQLIVMPRLRETHTSSFDTVGEFVDAFQQIFEGIDFMHEHLVAHKDISILNPRYYIIDFGFSRRYDPNQYPYDEIVAAGDRSAPELRRLRDDPSTKFNPFAFDVYCAGNMMRRDYDICCPDLLFLLPLVDDMTQDEPSLRPTIREALTCFVGLCNSLSTSQLPGLFVTPVGRIKRPD
ncbi:hypothetical protein EDD18DRAFT_1312559 [Armillaria luteobubalina]|uniref:Protein kinase domain-containing protein n=1 Tax=Armillaria luteobubalina TaxID=153913 RepID=A0AA39P6Q1_9AGAR|nr:hypothetical protein EDD18DRAFT_1312559 [Armillaria luteobubalina]